MKKIIVVIVAVLMSAGIACAKSQNTNCCQPDNIDKTAGIVVDTTKSAVNNTACVARTSVADPISAPKAAINAVQDTSMTAMDKADDTFKSITGQDK